MNKRIFALAFTLASSMAVSHIAAAEAFNDRGTDYVVAVSTTSVSGSEDRVSSPIGFNDRDVDFIAVTTETSNPLPSRTYMAAVGFNDRSFVN